MYSSQSFNRVLCRCMQRGVTCIQQVKVHVKVQSKVSATLNSIAVSPRAANTVVRMIPNSNKCRTIHSLPSLHLDISCNLKPPDSSVCVRFVQLSFLASASFSQRHKSDNLSSKTYGKSRQRANSCSEEVNSYKKGFVYTACEKIQTKRKLSRAERQT